MSHSVKYYRCGYCGTPTDDTAEQTQGDCCRAEHDSHFEQVTREMAMDAQDMRLEGQWIEW